MGTPRNNNTALTLNSESLLKGETGKNELIIAYRYTICTQNGVPHEVRNKKVKVNPDKRFCFLGGEWLTFTSRASLEAGWHFLTENSIAWLANR